ncbi:hypothetical protein DQX05_14280 [Paenibacillus thiaminolyticus]|uniref:Uncharacterized protein n=1 Tax=Paenibacillus thiaminolyticus TaxID=49283 RepID=A0A3A3GIQ1_PANTH|nr:hypothetical protein DQX05_14280 [Paenibacillus thiaminolyticus]
MGDFPYPLRMRMFNQDLDKMKKNAKRCDRLDAYERLNGLYPTNIGELYNDKKTLSSVKLN